MTPSCVSGDGCVLNSDPVGCRLHMCIYVCMCVYMYVCQCFWETDSQRQWCVSLLHVFCVFVCREILCVCVCVVVDCMYYADLGEPCAINKTGLQCAHWRNNLSDTMEKARERSNGREEQREREAGMKDRWRWREKQKEKLKKRKEQGQWLSRRQKEEKSRSSTGPLADVVSTRAKIHSRKGSNVFHKHLLRYSATHACFHLPILHLQRTRGCSVCFVCTPHTCAKHIQQVLHIFVIMCKCLWAKCQEASETTSYSYVFTLLAIILQLFVSVYFKMTTSSDINNYI